jgi:hypothetical protein
MLSTVNRVRTPRIFPAPEYCAAALAVGCLLVAPAGAKKGLDLEELAACIADSGAVFYGAHWCPYCHEQKESFGPYASLLPYVECYEPGKRKGMLAVCREAGVKSFPTWQFPDGSKATGAKSPEALARATGCH